MTRLARWLSSLHSDSPQAKRRELHALNEEIAWLQQETERLAQRRDVLVNELRPALRVVSRP